MLETMRMKAFLKGREKRIWEASVESCNPWGSNVECM